MTVKINLSNGLCAIVDNDDFDLAHEKWSCTQLERNEQYAFRMDGKITILMHRVIVGRIIGRELQDNEVTDHIDRNGLNNRRSNLRVATYQQNQANRGPQKNNKTGYKGVHRENGKFRVQVYFNGKNQHVGYFNDIHEAAMAYNKKAVDLFGEFAWVNKIND